MPYPLRSQLALLPALLITAPLSAQDYCPPDIFGTGVEPICRVAFADLDHSSPSGTDAPAYEEFTAFTAHIAPGTTYTVLTTGYTGGTPPNKVTIYFDWNSDQVFETRVDLDDILGGDCDTQAGGSFTVPADATIGASRTRVVKTYVRLADDNACAWLSGYGQAEDYTIDVSPTAGIVDLNKVPFGLFPNPNNGDFNLTNTGDDPNVEVRIMDLSGRIVHLHRTVIAPGAIRRLSFAPHLSPGSYSALISSGTITSVGRFIVD